MNAGKSEEFYKFLAENNLEMMENVPDEFKCLKCMRILINACQVPCGCRYCRGCLEALLATESQMCPGDSDDCRETNLSIFQTDFIANKKISKLLVKCPFGMCPFESELIDMNEHLRVCPNKCLKCVFYDLGCGEENVTLSKMNEHLQLENHSHMSMLMGIIDNMRNEMDRLKENDAQSRKEMSENDKNYGMEIDRLKDSDYRKTCEIELLKAVNVRNKNEFARLDTNNAKNKNEVQTLRQDLVTKTKRIESLEREIKTMKKQKSDKLRKEIVKTDAKIGAAPTVIPQQAKVELGKKENPRKEMVDKYQAEMQKRMNEAAPTRMETPNEGTLLWTVDRMREKRTKNDFLHSEYFHGKIRPYKMALRFDPNSNGDVGSNELTIVLYVFDDTTYYINKWPLRADVTIKVYSKARPSEFQVSTKCCVINKPANNSNKCSENFNFLYRNFIADCLVVECRVAEDIAN